MNQATLNNVVAAAKAKAANHPEWLRSIEKAAGMLASGELVVTLLAHDALVTSPNGSYRVNGSCPCAARTAHCYHRAAKRLAEMMEAAPATSGSTEPEVRPALIADINRMWPATWPPMYSELLARFGKSDLNMLDDGSLRRVRMAVAI